MFSGVYRPTREFFAHMETSPLPVKGCKLIVTYAQHSWSLNSEGSLEYHTYCDSSSNRSSNSNLRGPVTLTPIAECLAVELPLHVFTTVVAVIRSSKPNLLLALNTCLKHI